VFLRLASKKAPERCLRLDFSVLQLKIIRAMAESYINRGIERVMKLVSIDLIVEKRLFCNRPRNCTLKSLYRKPFRNPPFQSNLIPSRD
jgi:hypothetical protein